MCLLVLSRSRSSVGTSADTSHDGQNQLILGDSGSCLPDSAPCGNEVPARHADIHGHVAISEKVTFRYRDGRTQRLHRVRLPALQFLARFLQHVLPRGLAKVRYYGLFSPRAGAQRHQARALLDNAAAPLSEPDARYADRIARPAGGLGIARAVLCALSQRALAHHRSVAPATQGPTMIATDRLPRYARSPRAARSSPHAAAASCASCAQAPARAPACRRFVLDAMPFTPFTASTPARNRAADTPPVPNHPQQSH